MVFDSGPAKASVEWQLRIEGGMEACHRGRVVGVGLQPLQHHELRLGDSLHLSLTRVRSYGVQVREDGGRCHRHRGRLKHGRHGWLRDRLGQVLCRQPASFHQRLDLGRGVPCYTVGAT
eukprot:3385041-Rhodomonas_salina.2